MHPKSYSHTDIAAVACC